MLRVSFQKALAKSTNHASIITSPLRSFSSTSSAATTTINNGPNNIKYAIVGGFIITIAGGIKYINDQVGGTEGLERTLSFYSLAVPAYAKYRMHMFLESPDEKWKELDIVTSQQGLEKILELRGFYIKSGQMCAANIGNAFPKIWQETMSVLQDQCPHKPFEVVKSIIETEYNQPLSSIFETFDETPIGAASIGQVHRATLKNGQKVVVKIQYPEVERLFRGDVRTIKMFAQLAQPVHVPALNEVEKQFMTEFDYVREAEQMNQVRENLQRGSSGRGRGVGEKLKVDVKVPLAYTDLCTKSILVMEELEGEKLADALKNDMERHAARLGMTLDELQKKAEEENQAKDGPTAKEFDQYIRLLDSKRRLTNASAALYNLTVGWLPGFQKREYESRSTLPLNQAKIVDDLIYVHGHEVLVDGYFNGDPHPGNVFLLGVESGQSKLGLIDYGQVKKISKEERHLMCKIIIALADDNRPEIVRCMKEAGYKSKYMDEDIIYKYAKVSYDEDNAELTEGKHIQVFMEALQARDPIEQLPDQYIMVGRTSVMLRGLAHALRQSRSVAHAWKPIAEKVLKDDL